MPALRQRPGVHAAFAPRLRPGRLATAVSHSRRATVQPSAISTKAAAGGADMEVDALVIGSGVSGSTLGFYLNKRGVDVLLTEARDVVGGNVISKNEDGFLWEEGPNTFQPTRQIMRLAVDVGLKDELVFADHTLPRCVYWEGKLFPLPGKLEDAPFFQLLNPLEKIIAGIGALGLHAPPPAHEESVKEFIYRHLGEAVYKKIIDPFVSGVYAGDPAELSMKAAFYKIFRLENELGSTPSILEGGLLRQVELAQEKKKYFDPELPTYKGGALGSFKEGLLALPRAVQGTLGDKVKLGWKVESVTKEGEMYVTVFSTPEGTKKVRSKTVAVTAPAHATSKLLGDMMPEAAALDDISYPTVASVTLAYPKDALKDDVRRERPGLGMRLFGFGNLIPRSMKVRTLGTIWSSSLFPYRVPEGYEMMLSYIGGAQDPKNYSPAIAELSEAQIADIVHGDISTILLKDNAPQPKILGVRKWMKAIPQYNKGYFDIRAKVDEGLVKHPGIFLGGNYICGVAFGSCVEWGVDTAPKIAEYLETKAQAKEAATVA
eukprot:Tamp_01114.p2 GENE.Tamp_01114~~Tamp_01114.p2  ORF type:complete len:554 (-),score=171.66 Tamp_01114:4270-5907(-)